MSKKNQTVAIVKQPIETLPDEMLMEIFKAMDGKTLRESMLVHPKWNHLIGQSSLIMKPLRLVYKDYSQPKTEGCQKIDWSSIRQNTEDFTRKYLSLRISEAYHINQEAVAVMTKHVDLCQLELNDCALSLENREILTRILQSLTKLEVLKFHDTDMCVRSFEGVRMIKEVQMPNLKTVVLSKSNDAFLAFLASCELKTLKINAARFTSTEDYILEFLSTQKKIEKLALRDMNFDFVTVDGTLINEINFPLKKLALNKLKNFLRSEENSLKFLERFVDTLEELELGSTFPASVYEMIFMKFKKLKVLDVSLTHAPKEETFYHNLRPNVSVKKLVIRDLLTKNEQKFQGFIGNLPNVESLTIIKSSLTKEAMQFISNNLQKLEELDMNTLEGSPFKDVVLSNIKSLRINYLKTVSIEDWHAICLSLPNIQNFLVKNVLQMSSLSAPSFRIFSQGWKNLTNIDLGSGFIPSERIFTVLLRNTNNLKTVSIPVKDKNPTLADSIHRSFEKVQGPRLFYKSSKQQRQKHVGLWSNEDSWEHFSNYW